MTMVNSQIFNSPDSIIVSVSSEVSNLLTNSSSNSTLFISWSTPSIPNGIILNYSVSILNLEDGSTVRLVTVPADMSNILVDGLSKCNAY